MGKVRTPVSLRRAARAATMAAVAVVVNQETQAKVPVAQANKALSLSPTPPRPPVQLLG